MSKSNKSYKKCLARERKELIAELDKMIAERESQIHSPKQMGNMVHGGWVIAWGAVLSVDEKDGSAKSGRGCSLWTPQVKDKPVLHTVLADIACVELDHALSEAVVEVHKKHQVVRGHIPEEFHDAYELVRDGTLSEAKH